MDALSDLVHEYEAQRRWAVGEHPGFSLGICGAITAGYGRLDQNGYWQFPLYPGWEYLDLHIERTKNSSKSKT